jgi:glycosyltransferase involved in cell wall biosynthesis
MSKPLISIITPSLNRAQYIREAIQSVLDQNYPHVEHIVIDGVSTDRTMDVLCGYSHLRVVSEPDQGMYDAINKGIRMARGEVIGLLNTDDLYAADCFEAVVEVFEKSPQSMAVVGGIAVFEDKNNIRQFVKHVPAINPDELWYRLIQGSPVTNAWFFKRGTFDHVGLFDSRFRYVADRHFLIRTALDGAVRPVPIARELYYYRRHSGSATLTSLDSRTTQYGLLRIDILLEDIVALEDFLDRPVLLDEVRRRVFREHGERCYRLATTAIYHHRWKQGLNAGRRGWRRNVLWPLIFLEMAYRRLCKEFTGHD